MMSSLISFNLMISSLIMALVRDRVKPIDYKIRLRMMTIENGLH